MNPDLECTFENDILTIENGYKSEYFTNNDG